MTIDAHSYDRWADESPTSPFDLTLATTLETVPWDPTPDPAWESGGPWASWEYQVDTPSEAADDLETWLDDETEALLDEIRESAEQLAERALVRLAITKGNRSENSLSDLVFFRRHPERNGRSISRSEPNFQALADEWLRIRDTLVRPALQQPPRSKPRGRRRLDRSPSDQPTPPSGNWAAKRRELVRVALAEEAYWGNGTLREDQQRGWERIERYWDESGLGNTSRGRELAAIPWSAAFICWAVRQAGITEPFWTPNGYHSNYTVLLLRKATQQPDFPITVVPPYSVPLRPGDLVLNWYTSAFDLDELRSWVSKSGLPNLSAHSDIVTEVVPGSHATEVGGNVTAPSGGDQGLTVRGRRSSIDGNGVLVPQSNVVAVIRMGP